MDHVAYFGRGLRRERAYVLRQAPQLLVGRNLLIDRVGNGGQGGPARPGARPPEDVSPGPATTDPPILMQIGGEDREVGVVLERRRRGAVAPPLIAVALAATDRVVELPPHLDGVGARPTARRAREFQRHHVLARVRQERREGLDGRHHIAPFRVREPPPPPRHRAPGEPVVDRPREIRVGRKLAARRRADLVEPAGEVAGAREHVRCRRAVAGTIITVTTRTPLHVDNLPSRGVLGREAGDERREKADQRRNREARLSHARLPSPASRLPFRSSPTFSASTPSARTGTGSPTRSPAPLKSPPTPASPSSRASPRGAARARPSPRARTRSSR